ncbi:MULTISPECIES: class I SAM-dependent methyltransferase [unclassified Sphingomonas]|jgi:ubiquinone/menaquinone biosynthesis C-methylase UbiE|uniref:class I SAM-dependent methyltransferase n=1 Tax=unclassified Sphingomonas TaxID=196159 RepID=UPI00082D2D30|nr:MULTISPECIES: class I SAM-dependent methyltransferase [unclassified Sphingomonas]MBX3595246.1 class I SAM-dependent methyltransferase [Sphingomonas sp.]
MAPAGDAFVPALGNARLTRFYDLAIALLTRERYWRGQVLRKLAPGPDDIVMDVGCGTGTLAVMVKEACAQTQVIGVDPDPEVLAIARAKAERAAVAVEWRRAMGDELGEAVATIVVSSLVLHQCPLSAKRSIAAAMHAALRPGGRLVLLDYGEQRGWLMRRLFGIIQRLDGVELTQPNADGVLPQILADVGFLAVAEQAVIRTLTGSLSLYTARRGV